MAKKYRPYFTIPELSEVAKCLKIASNNTDLIKYVDSQIYKASTGLTEAQYIPHPKPSLEDKLELSGKMVSVPIVKVDLAAKRFQSYNKWKESPHKCTSQEIEDARMYQYTNDLMSPEEEAAYESKLDKGY